MRGNDIAAFRDHMRGYGAWDDSEIDAWTNRECNALLIQMVSGDAREAERLCPGDGLGDIDWTAYEALAHAGTISGRLSCDGKKIHFYVGD